MVNSVGLLLSKLLQRIYGYQVVWIGVLMNCGTHLFDVNWAGDKSESI